MSKKQEQPSLPDEDPRLQITASSRDIRGGNPVGRDKNNSIPTVYYNQGCSITIIAIIVVGCTLIIIMQWLHMFK
jgi:hypothetical protein